MENLLDELEVVEGHPNEVHKGKVKVAGRLTDADDTVTSLDWRTINLEKFKTCAMTELHDLTAEREDHLVHSIIIERRGKTEGPWGEVTDSQTECCNCSSDYNCNILDTGGCLVESMAEGISETLN